MKRKLPGIKATFLTNPRWQRWRNKDLLVYFVLPVVAVPGEVLLHVAFDDAVPEADLAHVAHVFDGGGGGLRLGGEPQSQQH